VVSAYQNIINEGAIFDNMALYFECCDVISVCRHCNSIQKRRFNVLTELHFVVFFFTYCHSDCMITVDAENPAFAQTYNLTALAG